MQFSLDTRPNSNTIDLLPLVLSKLSNVKPNSEGWTARCPVCFQNGGNDKTGNHLKIWRSGAYSCVVDKTHSSGIYALAGEKGSGHYEGGSTDTPQPEPQIETERTWPSSVLARLIRDDSYWHGRGISSATLAPFKGGVATIGQMKNRYVFPVFDDDDRIIGFDGRRIDGKPDKPWKILGPSSEFVWGGLDEIETTKRAILVESIGDSLMLREHGVPDSICLFGLNLSQAVLGKLVALSPDQIIVSTNFDTQHCAGQQAAIKIKKTLDTLFNFDIVSILHPAAKDWGCASHDQIQAAFNPPAEPQPDQPS